MCEEFVDLAKGVQQLIQLNMEMMEPKYWLIMRNQLVRLMASATNDFCNEYIEANMPPGIEVEDVGEVTFFTEKRPN